MAKRQQLALALISVFVSMGASYRTPNFRVEAPTAEVAQQVGTAAERYRKEQAVQWLGRELPAWSTPCPVEVAITLDRPAGMTTFFFQDDRLLRQSMRIEGGLDRLLASTLPHEVTHTVFAEHFRRPLPRWADEGAAVLSENDREKARQDRLLRQILRSGRAIPLSRLFALTDYPTDVAALYAQGYSVCAFLVRAKGRIIYLDFLAYGMRKGWDSAAHTYYGYRDVDDLEAAWLRQIKYTERLPVADLADAGGTRVADAAKPEEKGSIEGTITDQAGRKQPGLEVTLLDAKGKKVSLKDDKGKDLKPTTDASGTYLIKNLPPGDYRVTAKKTFVKGEAKVTVEAGKKAKGDIELRR
jgi:hypothetical protein